MSFDIPMRFMHLPKQVRNVFLRLEERVARNMRGENVSVPGPTATMTAIIQAETADELGCYLDHAASALVEMRMEIAKRRDLAAFYARRAKELEAAEEVLREAVRDQVAEQFGTDGGTLHTATHVLRLYWSKKAKRLVLEVR